MDILGPLIETPRGNAYLLVITDRYSKLTRSIPMSSVRAIDVARAFLVHWVYVYGPPRSVLTDNGTQFASRFLLEVYRILGIKGVFTATYHPQTNGQPERYNSTLLSALRKFVGEHPKTWDRYAEALLFGYNSHVHDVTGLAPFDLVVSRPTPSLFLEIPTTEYTPPRESHKVWLRRLRDMMATATQQLQERQRRYKAAFDARVRAKPPIAAGDYVFIRKQATTRRDEERHKLAPKAEGPLKVVSCDVERRVVVFRRHSHDETISIDRVELAPSPELRNDTQNVSEEFVVDEILSHRLCEGEEANHWEVKVKWYGFSRPTWQPLHDVRRSQVLRYCRRNKISPPANIDQTRSG